MSALVSRPHQHNTLNVYRTLPPHCIAFEVKDHHSMPFINPGEVVVVDTEDRTARVGDIYVIEWNGGSRNLCQARHSRWQKEGEPTLWNVGSMRVSRPEELEAWIAKANAGTIPVWTGGWTEGPFTIEHLESKLVGAVIGIYQPRKPVEKSNNGGN